MVRKVCIRSWVSGEGLHITEQGKPSAPCMYNKGVVVLQLLVTFNHHFHVCMGWLDHLLPMLVSPRQWGQVVSGVRV